MQITKYESFLKKFPPCFFIWRILPERGKAFIKLIALKFLRITRQDLNYFYDDSFAKENPLDKVWVDHFCDLVLEQLGPRSVIDFGCGTGDLLLAFKKRGMHILGLDGSRKCQEYSRIKENFVLFDLRDKYKSSNMFDLCICLEVVEHIEERYCDILAENLTNSAQTIIFSGAPPGQFGRDHINLKPQEWWIEKFKKHNFKFNADLTNTFKERMRKMIGIPRYYIDNLLIFKSELKDT